LFSKQTRRQYRAEPRLLDQSGSTVTFLIPIDSVRFSLRSVKGVNEATGGLPDFDKT
jgi:hypothetical protein